MVYFPHQGGGFVFSVGSISFGGSLVVDPILQRLVRNVVEEAFLPPPRLEVGTLASPQDLLALYLRPRFNMTYSIQGSSTLGGPWQSITNLTGNGRTQAVTIPLTDGSRFFRAEPMP